MNQLLKLFNLELINKLMYIEFISNKALLLNLDNEGRYTINSISIHSLKTIKSLLYSYILEIKPQVLIIRIKPQLETILLKILNDLQIKNKILLVKSIPYGNDVVLTLNQDYSYNINNIITKPGIIKLVNILVHKIISY